MNLKDKSILIADNGLYTFLAPFMARFYGKVYYHMLTASPYQQSPKAQIGKGLDGVEWVASMEQVLDTVDVIFFPDVYSGEKQQFLIDKGYAVCGSGLGEKMEQEKAWFLEQLAEAGLPVPKTYRAEGLDDVWEYVKDKPGPLYMKYAEKYRGDWETCAHKNKYATEILLNAKRAELGVERSKEIEILIQHPIESDCELGVDGFRLNGEVITPLSVGYEIKDKGLVARIMKDVPDILKPKMKAISGIYKKLGYRGPYSDENRITKSGKVYPIDETCRCPSPPTELLCEMLGKGYAEAVYHLAHGNKPAITYEFEFGAQVVLSSKWHFQENELHVGFPTEVYQWLKLKNVVKKGNGEYYCQPNGNDGIFGSMVAVSNKSWQDAAEQVMKRIEMLDVYQLDYDPNIFDMAAETIASGERWGVHFE